MQGWVGGRGIRRKGEGGGRRERREVRGVGDTGKEGR